MSSTKHTPGPWRIRQRLDKEGNFVILQDVENQTATWVGTVFNMEGRVPSDIANARLIAAAPELLDALVEIEQCAIKNQGSRDMRVTQYAMHMVRAAIAKATQP